MGSCKDGLGWLPADLCTRPQSPGKLGKGSVWQDGPAFIWEPESEWPIIKSFQKLGPEMLEEEEDEDRELVGLTRLKLAKRYSSWEKYVRVVVWVLWFYKVVPIVRRIPKKKEICEFKVGGKIRKVEWTHRAGIDQVLPVLDREILAKAEKEILKAVQMEIWGELVMSVAGQWSSTSHVPFTENNQMPIILPYDSPVTNIHFAHEHYQWLKQVTGCRTFIAKYKVQRWGKGKSGGLYELSSAIREKNTKRDDYFQIQKLILCDVW